MSSWIASIWLKCWSWSFSFCYDAEKRETSLWQVLDNQSWIKSNTVRCSESVARTGKKHETGEKLIKVGSSLMSHDSPNLWHASFHVARPPMSASHEPMRTRGWVVSAAYLRWRTSVETLVRNNLHIHINAAHVQQTSHLYCVCCAGVSRELPGTFRAMRWII